MIFILSLFVSISLGWIFFDATLGLENASLRGKWFAMLKKVHEEGPLFSWNRPLISLAAPFFQKHFPKYRDPFFLAWSCWLSLEGAIFFLLLFGFSRKCVVIGALLGAAYPSLQIFFKKKERLAKIRSDLPFVMDLLAISVAAGLDMMQAIQRIVKMLPSGALTAELEKMLKNLQLGLSRKEALTLLKEEIPLPEIRGLVAMLLQALSLGSPVAPVLVAGADQMRSERWIDAERLGIKAAQKILFPLMLCILPAIFLTIFSPLLIRWLTGGFGNLL